VPAVKSLHLPQHKAKAWLGITPPKASPILTGVHVRVSSTRSPSQTAGHESVGGYTFVRHAPAALTVDAVPALQLEPGELPACSTPRSTPPI